MNRINKRKPEIMALNVFLCLLVIFIHVSSVPVTSLEKNSLQYAVVLLLWRYANFAVQGFIFLGGFRFFLSRKDGIDYIKFYKGRLIKIIIPYIIWNIIYYLYFISKDYFSFSFSDLTLYLIRGDLVSPFYFVVVIIQFYALAPLWRLIVTKLSIIPTLIAAGVLTLLAGRFLPVLLSNMFPEYSFHYNDRILTTYLVYWLAGCYVGMYFDKAKEWVKEHKYPIAAVFVLVLLSEGALSYMHFSGIRYISWLENVHFLYCLGAILFFFMLLSLYYENRAVKNRLVLETDRAAYPIYLTHCLVIFIVNDWMAQLGITRISTAYVIRIFAVYSITIALCILWNKCKTRVISAYKAKKQKLHT